MTISKMVRIIFHFTVLRFQALHQEDQLLGEVGPPEDPEYPLIHNGSRAKRSSKFDYIRIEIFYDDSVNK